MKRFENFDFDWNEEETQQNVDKYGREIIKISDITDDDYPYDIDGFNVVKDETSYFDSEKGFVDNICVLQREKDGKFFKVEYTDFGMGDSNFLEQIAVEVKRKVKKVYYYE